MRLSLLMATWVASLTSLSLVRAEEPAQVFLEALRDSGYYNVAIDYLNDLEKSDLISDEFRSSLPFEKAEILIGSTSRLRDLGLIEERLDEAQKLLTQYASQNQSLEVSARTRRYQGNLLFKRSNIYIKQTRSDRATEGEKEELRGKARNLLEQSLESYSKAKEELKRLVDPKSPDAVRIDPEDPSTGKKLKQLQNSYVQVRVRLPLVTEQLADTYPDGDSKGKKLLAEASKAYQNVHDDYRRFHAGLQSIVFAARCEQKLGKTKETLDLLGDIFDLGNNSSLKPLKLEAYFLATESWSKTDPYPYSEVINRLEPAVKVLNRVEMKTPNWLRIQLELAVAKRANAEAVRKKGGAKANQMAGDLDRSAARTMRNVAKVPGIYRDQARALMSEWNISTAAIKDPSEKAPTNFSEARQKAKDLVGELEIASGQLSAIRKKIRAEKDADKKTQLQTELSDATAELREQANGALSMLNLALDLADENTVRADINNVRYLQSFCYYASRQYIESALIGEHLLAKYPSVPGTQQAMSLMIQSYSNLLDSAKPDDKEFESSQLVNACNAVIGRWSGSSEAGAAASTMTRLSINNKDFTNAEKYFQQIPKDAGNRGPLGISVGQRMWLDIKNKIKGGEDIASFTEQLTNAKSYMEQGVANAAIDSLDYPTALGALMLVDAYVTSGEVDKAVNQLESAAIAPLDLVKQKHPAISRNATQAMAYSRETYNNAVKTYLAAMKTSSDKQKWVKKASGVIAAMRQAMETSNDPQDRVRLTIIYQRIAKELKSDFDALTSKDEKKEFASALSTFLDSISKDSEDPGTILWAGSTLRSVGESLISSSLSEEAQPLFQSAVEALNKVEKIGFKNGPDEQAMLSKLKLQRALSQRGAGNYEAAVDQLSEILKLKPSAINVQIEACETLQQWGKASGRSKKYSEATKGTGSYTDPKTKRKKKLIWGWEKIALATRRNEKFRDTFFNALYHVAECRLEYGIIESKPKAIAAARKEIDKERERDPTFAGKAIWAKKFDELEARIDDASK